VKANHLRPLTGPLSKMQGWEIFVLRFFPLTCLAFVGDARLPIDFPHKPKRQASAMLCWSFFLSCTLPQSWLHRVSYQLHGRRDSFLFDAGYCGHSLACGPVLISAFAGRGFFFFFLSRVFLQGRTRAGSRQFALISAFSVRRGVCVRLRRRSFRGRLSWLWPLLNRHELSGPSLLAMFAHL
jgi:hypothetical protein